MRSYLDQTDRRLAKLLSEDAQEGVNQLAERLNLSPPTVRSRLRALMEKNLLKIVGLLNVSERPELIAGIVGISVQTRGQLGRIAEQISALPFVTSVSIVTGRYDIIAEVLVDGDVQDLYRVTSEYLPQVAEPGVVSRSETFVVMKSHNKWVNIPKGCWEDNGNTEGTDDRR